MPHFVNTLHFKRQHPALKKHPVAGRAVTPRGIQSPSQDFCRACSRGRDEPNLFDILLRAFICELLVKLIHAKYQFPSDGSILSAFPHAQNKCCKKCETRSHFPHWSVICYMRCFDIVSSLYISHLIPALFPCGNPLAFSALLHGFSPANTHCQDLFCLILI